MISYIFKSCPAAIREFSHFWHLEWFQNFNNCENLTMPISYMTWPKLETILLSSWKWIQNLIYLSLPLLLTIRKEMERDFFKIWCQEVPEAWILCKAHVLRWMPAIKNVEISGRLFRTLNLSPNIELSMMQVQKTSILQQCDKSQVFNTNL